MITSPNAECPTQLAVASSRANQHNKLPTVRLSVWGAYFVLPVLYMYLYIFFCFLSMQVYAAADQGQSLELAQTLGLGLSLSLLQMSYSTQLVDMFREHVELLQVQHDAGASAEQLRSVSDTAVAAFVTQAGLLGTLTRADAITMIRMLGTSLFREGHRADILGAINGIGCVDLSANREKQQLQSFTEFHKYPTSSLSGLLAARNTPYSHKIQALGVFLSNLGATNLNEPGWCGIVATWLALETCGDVPAACVSPSAAYQRLQDLKHWMRGHRQRCRMPHHGRVTMFPSTPN